MRLHPSAFFAVAIVASAQNAKSPLESLTLKGTDFSREIIETMAGLHIGEPVDRAQIEAACNRLQESGLFASVQYSYAPGPKRGYALTLNITDQPITMRAFIDLPGVGEEEIWKWLSSQYPNYSHHVPDGEAALQYLSHEIEQHVGAKLDGQHLAAQLEQDMRTHQSAIVFQLAVLPQITGVTFTGVQELRSDDLAAMLRKSMGDEGFSQRKFRVYLEGVVRQAYEEHGYYKLTFGDINVQKSGLSAVALSIPVSEGHKYTLGDVQVVGNNLPEGLLKEVTFQRGKTANWTEIQQNVYKWERPVKRAGYFDAVSHAERIPHDDTHQLDVRVSFTMGPLYHFGQVSFEGLPPKDEEPAHKMWKMETGATYDFAYGNDFMREFSRSVDLRGYKVKVDTRKNPGNVMDERWTFEPK